METHLFKTACTLINACIIESYWTYVQGADLGGALRVGGAEILSHLQPFQEDLGHILTTVGQPLHVQTTVSTPILINL